MSLEQVASKGEVRRAVAEARREGRTIALVPTMGALHEGHLSLVRAACARATYVVVSIFVNPTQFGPTEDFDAYPRDIVHDLELLAAEGVDLVFTPSTATMYDADSTVEVAPGPLADVWEGAVRPGHFTGVATVVAKLLNVVGPDLAFFGEKDYQQLMIIKRLVRDLDLPVTVVGRPIVRDRDGLALSSRNAYLSPDERARALALSEAIDAAAQAVAWGERSGSVLEQAMSDRVGGYDDVELDYAAVVDPDTLERMSVIDRPARAIIAARVGSTRLIDNAEIRPPEGD